MCHTPLETFSFAWIRHTSRCSILVIMTITPPLESLLGWFHHISHCNISVVISNMPPFEISLPESFRHVRCCNISVIMTNMSPLEAPFQGGSHAHWSFRTSHNNCKDRCSSYPVSPPSLRGTYIDLHKPLLHVVRAPLFIPFTT